MLFGAITNSWRNQLMERDLADLISEAEARGSRHIELRQTCLGNCEAGQGEDWRPNLDGLQAIVDRFTGLNFDLAMALPCLSEDVDPRGEQFQMALAGARIVGRDNPHLRLVDPSPSEDRWQSPEDIPAQALNLANLAREAASQGVVLSMENSGQTIGSMAILVEECRKQLSGEEAVFLGLCPDPTNQLRRFPDSDPPGRPGFSAAGYVEDCPLQAGPGWRPSPLSRYGRPGLWRNAPFAGGKGLPGSGHNGDSAPSRRI